MAKKKLSIAQIHWGFPPIIGGVETHLTILLPMMVKLGHKVNLLTGSFEGVRGRYKYKGVGIHRTPLMDLNWLAKRGLNGIGDEIEVVYKKFVDEVKPDVIHTHNMHYFSKSHAVALQDICHKKGIPLFLTAHNVWDDNMFLDLTKNIKWDHIIAVSHFIKREIIGTGYHHRNITVVHHGIDQKIYHPEIDARHVYKKYPILKGRPVIFHPARMGLAKGCDVSIKALPLIKKRFPNIVLILAGTKNIIDWSQSQQADISYMVRLINFLGLKKNVLIDVFPLVEMPALYAVTQVCLYPSSVCEPFGLTMLEALATATPMVVTEMGGMPEIIKDGINGYVVPVKDFESLATKVNNLLSDYELRDRFGYTGRRMVEQQYTKEIVTQNTLKLYRNFC